MSGPLTIDKSTSQGPICVADVRGADGQWRARLHFDGRVEFAPGIDERYVLEDAIALASAAYRSGYLAGRDDAAGVAERVAAEARDLGSQGADEDVWATVGDLRRREAMGAEEAAAGIRALQPPATAIRALGRGEGKDGT